MNKKLKTLKNILICHLRLLCTTEQTIRKKKHDDDCLQMFSSNDLQLIKIDHLTKQKLL
jgi:hypothetical protein